MHFTILILLATINISCGLITNPTTRAFMGKLSIDSPTPVFLPPSRDESFAKDQFPKLLYLPGLDGTGLSAVAQYEDLESQFEFHRLCIARVSRVSFEDLVEQGEIG